MNFGANHGAVVSVIAENRRKRRFLQSEVQKKDVCLAIVTMKLIPKKITTDRECSDRFSVSSDSCDCSRIC